MINIKTLNGHEKIAYKNIYHCINWEVGGWYNCLEDGCPEYIPDTKEEAIEIIYNGAMNDKYDRGYCGSNKAPKEMRFAGKEFVMNAIIQLLEKDGDWKYINEEKGWK